MKRISLFVIASLFVIGHSFAQTKNHSTIQYHGNSSTTTGDGMPKEEKLYVSSVKTDRGTKYGYVDQYEKLIIPRIFDFASYFLGECAIVVMDDFKGIIDKNGNIAIPIIYDFLDVNSDGSVTAMKGNFYGLLTTKGEIILPFIYQNIKSKGQNLVSLITDNKEGLYNFIEKKWLIPQNYSNIKYYTEYIIAEKLDNKIDLFYTKTFSFLDSTYSSISHLKDNFFVVKKNNFSGILGLSNKIIVPIIYETISNNYQYNNLLFAKKNNGYGVITYDNRILVDFIYDEIIPNQEVFVVKRNNKFGIIDPITFKETTPCIYDKLIVSNAQRIFAQKNNKYGIITYDNTLVGDFVYDFPKYDKYTSFTIIYQKNKKYGFYDLQYKVITEAVYDTITALSSEYDKFYLVKNGNQKYLHDRNGVQVANISEYDNVIIGKNKVCIVSKNGKYGILNGLYTSLLLPIKYDLITTDKNGDCFVIENEKYYKVTYDENKPVLTLVK